MIKAILFDFGGVFMRSPFSMIDEVAADMQVEKALLKNIVFGDYTIDGNHPWHKLERGEITLEQAREGIIEEGKKHGLETDIYQMLARFATVEKKIRGLLVDKTAEWKQRGYQTAMITNNIREFTSWRTAFPCPIEELFDVIVDSSQIGIRKPDPAIYHYTLKLLGIEPVQALFLDDYPSNIMTAEALGIRGLVVRDGHEKGIEEVIDWVEKQLLSTISATGHTGD